MRGLTLQSSGFGLALLLPGAAFSGVKTHVPSPLSFATSSLRSRAPRLTPKKQPSAGPDAEAHQDRMSGPGTKRTLSRISPRSGVEGRPEVVGAVQNDEIDATRMSRIRRHGHKPRTSFTVDDRDRCPASGPSASMSPPNASSTSLVSTLVFWPSNASSIV